MTGQAIACAGDELPAQPQQHHACPYMDSEMPPHKHAEHHKFLEECAPLLREFLDERKRARERWAFITNTATGALVSAAVVSALGVFAWLGGVVIEAFRHWLNSGAPGAPGK